MATGNTVERADVTHHLRHRWDDETTLSEHIVTSVAGYEDTDPASLPSMGGSINPAALDDLFATAPASETTPGCVTFSYYGYTVLVQSTGRVLLRKE